MINKSIWTLKKEKLLSFWKEESRIYSWLHEQNSKKYQRMDKNLSIPSLLISAVTSTALFSSINMDDNVYVIVSFGILLIFGTFLQSIRDFLGVPDLIHKNSNCSDLYMSIVNDIEEQLSRENNERDNAKQFIQKIKTRKNDILKNRVSIGSNLWLKLKKSVNNGDVVNLYSSNFFKEYISKINGSDDVFKGNDNKKNKNGNKKFDNDNNIDNENKQYTLKNIDCFEKSIETLSKNSKKKKRY